MTAFEGFALFASLGEFIILIAFYNQAVWIDENRDMTDREVCLIFVVSFVVTPLVLWIFVG